MLPKWLVCLFFVGWLTNIFALFSFGDFSLTVWLINWALFLLYIARSVRTVNLLTVCILCLYLISFSVGLSFLNAGSILPSLVQQLIAVTFFLAGVTINWSKYFNFFLSAYKGAFLICLVYGFAQYFARTYHLPLDYLPMTNLQLGSDEGFQRGYSFSSAGFNRVSSFFAEPSFYARFNAGFAALVLSGFYRKSSLLYLVLCVVTIQLTESATAFVVLLIMFGVTLIFTDNRNRKKLSSIALLMIPLAVLLFPDTIDTLVRKTITGDPTDQRRFKHLADNILLILDKPIFGHGLGSTIRVSESGVYNSFTFLALERGFVGLALYISTYLLLVTAWIRRTKDNCYARFIILILVSEFLFLGGDAAIYAIPTHFFLGIVVHLLNNHSVLARAKVVQP